MKVDLFLVMCGLACLVVAVVWMFGMWGLAGAGLGLIVAGLVPEWERVHAVNPDSPKR